MLHANASQQLTVKIPSFFTAFEIFFLKSAGVETCGWKKDVKTHLFSISSRLSSYPELTSSAYEGSDPQFQKFKKIKNADRGDGDGDLF